MECTITFCDMCNIDQDTEKFQALAGQEDEAEPVGFLRGTFRGTFDQASFQDNWAEGDCGHICSHCRGDEYKRLEEEEAGDVYSGFLNVSVEPPAFADALSRAGLPVQLETSVIQPAENPIPPKRGRGRPKGSKNVRV